MKLVALVLAAGAGKRFGGDKLSAGFRGEPLIAHAIRAARAAPVEQVIVVCPPGFEIGAWDASPPVTALHVESDALSVSLKAGIAAAGDVRGAFVFLGDMPLVPHGLAAKLAAALGDAFAAVPRRGGRNGHPVLFASRAFAEIGSLEGDSGAGQLLATRGDVAFVGCTVETIHLDVDRAEDIARLEARGDTDEAGNGA